MHQATCSGRGAPAAPRPAGLARRRAAPCGRPQRWDCQPARRVQRCRVAQPSPTLRAAPDYDVRPLLPPRRASAPGADHAAARRSAPSALPARQVLRSPGAARRGAWLCAAQEAEDDDWEPELPEGGLEDSLEDGAGEEGSEQGRALAVALARAASDTKALDVLVLHVAPLVYWTSYLACPCLP
jgi:hypothetical protein